MPPTNPSAYAGLGTDTVLDAPPPSPAQPPMPQGGLGALVGPGMGAANGSVPSGSQPEPVLKGIMEAGVQIGLMLDQFAQATPDLAADWDAVKEALQSALGKLMVAGAPPTGPTSPGSGFPGGGFDRGPIGR